MITIEAWMSRLLAIGARGFRLITIEARRSRLLAIGVGGLG